jgi:hypothetical protein
MPPRHSLLKSQRNDVLQILRANDFDPRQFDWNVALNKAGTRDIDVLTHRTSGYQYAFDWFDGPRGSGHYAVFTPAADSPEGTDYPGSWDYQAQYFARWLGFLAREVQAPDLWAEILAGEPLLESQLLDDADDSPFSADEVAAIKRGIEEVKVYLRAELPPGSEPTVRAQLDRLEENLAGQGRVTWAQMAIGAFVGMVWAGLMDPDKARSALQILGQALRFLILPPSS